MSHRTTIVLDDDTRRAARELALRYNCSVSEAIRRAIRRQHDRSFGVPAAERHRRKKVLTRLFELFEGNDPVEEIKRLKSEDIGF